ncbi:MAG: hypothetical protein AB1705_08145 [Verrucomicrobiota bacterium]
MEASVQVFWVPKEGYSPDEYEDAFSCAPNEGQFAIADGATESSFSDLWAQALVNKYTNQPPPGAPPNESVMSDWITPLQKEWHASINWERLPWYAEEKARTGAFAAWLGARFLRPAPQEKGGFLKKMFGMFGDNKSASAFRWQAIAVGDSNMFQIRNNTLIRCFPLEKAAQFDSRPMLLASNPSRNKGIWNELRFVEGDYQDRDLFIMATDAIAKWFLAQAETGARPWNTLAALKSDEEYATLIGKLRKNSAIRNDDTTVIIFQWKAIPTPAPA